MRWPIKPLYNFQRGKSKERKGHLILGLALIWESTHHLFHKPEDLVWTLWPTVEGGSWLLKVIFWPSHVCIHSVQCFHLHLSHNIIKFNYKIAFSLFVKYNHWKNASVGIPEHYGGSEVAPGFVNTNWEHTQTTGITLEFGKWELFFRFCIRSIK